MTSERDVVDRNAAFDDDDDDDDDDDEASRRRRSSSAMDARDTRGGRECVL